MQEHKSTFAPLPARRQNSALAEAVRQLSNRIRDHKAAGGVLFVHSAAQATCFANRCPNLRAIVGTSDLSVEQGVKLLGANVMIVEYPMHGPRSMRGLIDRFTQTQRKPLPQVEQQLRELGTCV
jgi:ribose 5-phosphate isomerase RpiB